MSMIEARADGPHRGAVRMVGRARPHGLRELDSGNNFDAEVHGDPVNGAMVFWRNPDLPRDKYQWPPTDTGELIEFAHATVEHCRGIDPTTPIGGKLILAELTEQAVTISVAGDLGMPALQSAPAHGRTPSREATC
jgi:hypothetical protein